MAVFILSKNTTMKLSTISVFLLALFTALAVGGTVSACNLSNISVCGVYKTPLLNTAFPGDSMICLTVCNGYGRTGTSKGADNDTRSISFGWYTHRSGFLIRAFSPATITSGRGFTNCTMPGSNIGPQGPPYNSQGTILYVDPGYYGTAPCVLQPFGCVTSTTLCGNVAQQCITYRFQVNKIPDSVRVFGVEGGGNPVAGCYPDADMKAVFIGLSIEWGNVERVVGNQTVEVKWSTLSETNSDFFIVQRAYGANGFEDLGTVTAAGNSHLPLQYTFTDLAPMPGSNRYRIVEVDRNGQSNLSSTVEAIYGSPAGLAWGSVAPNPAKDFVHLTFYNDKSETMTLALCDVSGKFVIQKEFQAIQGANILDLALETVDAGVYYVRVQGDSGKLTRKIVKL